MPQLMTIGEILVEIMARDVGQTFLTPGTFLGPYPSGAPAICIDQAARLGADCGIIACVGADDFGRLNLDRLAVDGADVSGVVQRGDKVTGVAFVTYAPDGSRKFIFHFADAAAGALCPEDVTEEALTGTKILHVMGCSLSASEGMREAVLKGAKLCKAHGGKLSFDPNVRPELLSVEGIRQAFDWILNHCDILLTGDTELALIAGQDTEHTVQTLLAGRAEIVVLKSGSRGARVVAQGLDEVIPSYTVQQVDPTGAGDCFDGAFLAMLLAGKTPGEAARIANAAGAYSVTVRGPMEGAARWADIQALLGREN